MVFAVSSEPIVSAGGAKSRTQVRRIWWAGIASAALAFTASETKACVLLPIASVGTAAEKAAWVKAGAREGQAAVRARRHAFRNMVRAGSIDAADGLAMLLIPNIREWSADRSDCGGNGDGDGPSMPDTTIIAEAFAGSNLDGLDEAMLGDVVSPTFRRAAIQPYRRACSAEFRAGFAQRLRSALGRNELVQGYLMLSRDGEQRTGLYGFTDTGRSIRPSLIGQERNARAASILTDSSLAISRALDGFWRDAATAAHGRSFSCPSAFEALALSRDEELDRLKRQPRYALLVARAALRERRYSR